MSTSYLSDVNLSQNQLLNARIHNNGSAPSSPVTGQVYYDTTLNQFGVYCGSGTGWLYLTAASGANVEQSGNSSESGLMKVSSGANTNITDYAGGAGIVKSDGSGKVSAAVSGTDYAPATTGTSILKAASGGFANAVSGTDYAPATSGTSILKGNGSGAFSNAAAGTDYLAPSGNGSGLTGLTQSQISGLTAALALLAPLASPTFTGTVTVPTPVNPTDAASKGYVDSAVQGLDGKPSVDVVATSNLTLSGTQTIDGVSVTAGMRVLASAQSTGSQNGIWVVASGAWTRPSDFASGSVQQGAYVFVEGGTNGQNQGWFMTGTSAVTVDTSSQTWTQFNGATDITAGTGLSKSGNTISLSTPVSVSNGGTGGGSVSAAKSSLGFASLYNSGTIGDGSSTTLTVTHNLGNSEPLVQVWLVSGTYPVLVYCDVTATSSNAVQLSFGTAPASNSIKVVVVG